MTTVPSIPKADRIADYTATSGQTDFAIPWVVIADSLDAAVDDLVVDVDGAAIDLSTSSFVGVAITDLSGIWNGGTLTIPACTTGQRVVIYSNREPRRTSSFLEGKSLPFTTLDQLEDDIAIQLRDLNLGMRRALKLTPEEYLDGGSPEDIVSEILAASSAATSAASAASGSATAAATSASGASTSASTASASASAAAASALAVANGIRNILSLFNSTEIAAILAGDNSVDLTTKVSNAMTATPGVAWYWPAGTYFFNNTLALPSGMNGPRWVGAGPGVTIIKLGGSLWGIEQLNPNGTSSVRGLSAEDITFRISNNGIRLNSLSGGFDDTSGTQYYIIAPVFERCEFIFNSSPSTKVLLEFNKCFNGGVNKSKFSGGHIQVELEGSDLCWVTENRMDAATDGCVVDFSHNTFGSTNLIAHNDMNNPKNYFYRGNNRDGKIVDNHMELDFSPGSTGSGGNMEAAIDIVTGNNFQTYVARNRVDVTTFCDHWLRYRFSNPYSLIVEDNGGSGAVAASPDIPALPYWNNSSGRMICRHSGNHFGESVFPMNYDANLVASSVYIAQMTASRPGVTLTGIGGSLLCSSGAFKLPADANTGHYIEFSDWGALALPGNTIKGTLLVDLLTYGDVAGQVLHYDVLDNGVSVASGTITHTVANQMYETNVGPAFAVATKLQIRLWNSDTGHGGNVYMQWAGVRPG